MAVNGSNSTGRCTNFFPSVTRQNCWTPTSSVLFDGNVPTLTGLDGDMWASRLLTINTTANTAEITFDFTDTPDYTGKGRVEVVIFNCPEWGISVRTISLISSTSRTGSRTFLTSISPITTSCDSLVRVCISHNVSSDRPVLALVFTPPSTSNWVHLAEVTFYASGSTCPPDTLITPPPTTASSPILPKTAINRNITVMTTETMGNVTSPSSDSTIIIISVVAAISIILIIVTIIAILILWKLYSTKHKNYKHNASTDTALGESYTTRQQHNSHLERGHASLCKETGQVYYSTPEDGGGEADPIYNRLTHDTHNTGGQFQDTRMNSTLQGNYEMGEYSTVSNCRLSQGGTGEKVSTAHKPLPQLFNAQVDKKKRKKKSPPQTPQPYTPLDQMYAHVDKKKGKKREVSGDPPCESGDVYSVVNKPSAPEITQKSQLLEKDLQSQNY